MARHDVRTEVRELWLDPDRHVPPDGSQFQPLAFFAERPDHAVNGPHLPLAIICWQCWEQEQGRVQMLELAMLRCTLALYCGRLLSVDEALVLLHDPGRPLPPDLMRVTGLTSAALAGRVLRPQDAAAFLDGVGCAIAVSQGQRRQVLEQAVPATRALLWLSGELITWAQSEDLFTAADPSPASRRALRRCLKAARELSGLKRSTRDYFRARSDDLLAAAQAAAERSRAAAMQGGEQAAAAPEDSMAETVSEGTVPPSARRYHAPRLLSGDTPPPHPALPCGLRVWRAGTPGALLERCAAIMRARPPPDVLTPEWLVAEQADLTWRLEQDLATSQGLAAHCRHGDLTALAWDAYCSLHRLPAAPGPEHSLFARPRLLLALAALLQDAQCPVRLSELQPAGGGDCWRLAAQLAALFDRYQRLRPQWLAWACGLTPEELALREDERQSGRLRVMLEQQLEAMQGAGMAADGRLCQVLSWQLRLWGLLHLRAAEALSRERPRAPEEELRLLAMDQVQLVGQVSDVLRRPWQSTQLHYAALPQRVFVFGLADPSDLQLRFLRALSGHAAVHVMLLCPGAAAAERRRSAQEAPPARLCQWSAGTRGVLRALHPAAGELQDEEREPEGDSALAQLQRRLLHPLDPAGGRGAVGREDASLQIRRCRSPMDELETVYAALMARHCEERAAGGEPQLSAVRVMAPDISRYAPFIPAVFAAPADPGSRPLAYTIEGCSLLQSNPLAGAVLELLALGGEDGPLTCGRLMQLLDCRALRLRFALSGTEVAVLEQLMDAAAPCTPELRRLLTDSLRGGLTAAAAAALGRLQACCLALEGLRTRLRQCGALSLRQWSGVLEEVLEDFFAAADRDLRRQLSALHDLAARLCGDASAAPLESRPGPGAFAALLRMLLEERFGGGREQGGGITFCSLTPGRALPCRHLFMIGMDAGSFPRREAGEDYDLTRLPAPGADSGGGDGDGALLVRTLLTAGESLHLSWADAAPGGGDGALSSVAAEALLELLDECCDCGCDRAGQPLSARERFAAREPSPCRPQVPDVIRRELPGVLCLGLEQVRAFCRSPCRTYLAGWPCITPEAPEHPGSGTAAADGGAPDPSLPRTRSVPLEMVVQVRDPAAASSPPRRVRIRLHAVQTLSRGAGEELCIVCHRHAGAAAAAGSGTDPDPGSLLEAAVCSCCAVLCGSEMAAPQSRYDVLLAVGGGRQLCLRGLAASRARPVLRRLLAWYALALTRPLPVCARFLDAGDCGTDFGEDEDCCRLFGGRAPDDAAQRALFEEFLEFYQELRAHMLVPARRSCGGADEGRGGGGRFAAVPV